MSAYIASECRVASMVMKNLPEIPGYNGSILKIDGDEAARISEVLDRASNLIGANPELLGALIGLVEFPDESEILQEEFALWENARAAIAKAIGKDGEK